MDPELFNAAKAGELKALREKTSAITREVTFRRNNVLHIAAREGHAHVVQWILQVRPCLALSRNTDKNTPLHEAARKRNNGGVVEMLLRYSKRPAFRRNQFGETPLVIAAANGHTDEVRLLLDATPLCMVFWPGDDRRTCLATAVYGGHLEVVKLILRGKPTCFHILRFILFIQDDFGATALHAAVHSGHLEIVREILNTSLNLCCGMPSWDKNLMTMEDKHERCALHIAAMMGNVKIVELFLTSKPDCAEIRNKSLKTALHWAVEYNQIAVVENLLGRNAGDVNAKLVSYDSDIEGNTALHLGAMKGVNPELMEYLLSFPGVDVNAMNEEGLTALNIAEKHNFAALVSILEKANASRRLIVPPLVATQEYIRQDGGEEFKIPDVDTLVASLISTVTFAAMFQVPGGFDEKAGVATMSLTTVFNVFLFSNSLAFFASMSVVLAWIFRFRLQAKIDVQRSTLGKLSMLSLATSVISTALAFFCATVLVTVPRGLEKWKDSKKKHQYELLFTAEIVTAFAVPLLALVFLSIAWLLQYNFTATNARQAELKTQLKRVVISTLPVATILLVILFTSIVNNI